MPTNRLNISIVDAELIKELKEIREYCEKQNNNRYSMSEIIKALIRNKRHNLDISGHLI